MVEISRYYLSKNTKCIWGVGYIDNKGNTLFQYYDCPLSIYNKEACKYLLNASTVCLDNKLLNNIVNALYDTSKCINDILDIEFIF